MRRLLGVAGLWSLALWLGACVTTGPSSPGPPPAPSGDGPLEGYRYEAVRVLSERLVERLEATSREARGEARFHVNELLKMARDFADRMRNYQDPPRYVRDDVARLDDRVRDIDSRLERGDLTAQGQSAWRGVLDVMDRLKRALAGEIVDLPPAGGSSGPDWPGPISPGPISEDFRRLAHELAVRATLAYESAARVTSATERDRRLLSDLDYFRQRARDLDERAAAASGDPGSLGPAARSLRQDAQRIDRALAQTTGYARAREDWEEVLRLLERLESRVRN